MRLTYETGVATFVQFVVISLLTFGSQVSSIVGSCTGEHKNCITNSLSSILYFMLLVLWFGFIWILGYSAQKRRSRQLCRLLIAVEVGVMMIALFDLKRHTTSLGLITSAADLLLAAWVIYLALRLKRARGGRIRSTKRPSYHQ